MLIPSPAILKPHNREFSRIALACGIARGLTVCLDAGDGQSYDGNGSTWYDRSGTACHFNMGNGGLNKPTFQPGAWYGGRSGLNYMAYDGAAWNSVASAPAWMQNLHKAGGKWGILAWVYWGAFTTTQAIFATYAAPAGWSGIGVLFGVLATSGADWNLVLNGGTAGGVVSIPGFTHQTGRWECYALCVDVDTPGKCFSFLNGASGAGGSAVGAASASNYDGTPFIGLIAGDTTTALNNGSRLGGVLMWESRRPRVDEFMNFYQATRGRYRV